MSNDKEPIQFRIEPPKGKPFGWPQLREFMDAVVASLRGGEDSVAGDAVELRAVETGSAKPLIWVPPRGAARLGALRKPLSERSTDDWRHLSHVERWTRKTGCRLQLVVTQGGEQLFEDAYIAPFDATQTVERTLARELVRIERAGGNKGTVEFSLRGERLSMEVGHSVATELAQRLYQPVVLEAEFHRGLLDGQLKLAIYRDHEVPDDGYEEAGLDVRPMDAMTEAVASRILAELDDDD